jgi:hypothetical protein
VGRVGLGRGLTGALVGGVWIGVNVTRTGLAGTEGFFVAGASVTRGAMAGEAVNGTAIGLFVVIRDIVGETVTSGTAVAGNGIGETVVGAGTAGAVVTLDAEAGDPVESSGSHELGGFEDTWHIPCAIHSSYALTLAYTAGVFGLAQPEKEEEM